MFDIDIKIRGGLDAIKELKKEARVIEELASKRADVGVFDSKSDRDDGKSNAEIGVSHEYGVPQRGLPQRSFLRQPIIDGTFESLLDNTEIEINRSLLSQLGKIFLKAVKEEFNINGKGSWANLSEKTERKQNKNRDQILRDTKQLYKSIDMRVVTK